MIDICKHWKELDGAEFCRATREKCMCGASYDYCSHQAHFEEADIINENKICNLYI